MCLDWSLQTKLWTCLQKTENSKFIECFVVFIHGCAMLWMIQWKYLHKNFWKWQKGLKMKDQSVTRIRPSLDMMHWLHSFRNTNKMPLFPHTLVFFFLFFFNTTMAAFWKKESRPTVKPRFTYSSMYVLLIYVLFFKTYYSIYVLEFDLRTLFYVLNFDIRTSFYILEFNIRTLCTLSKVRILNLIT